VQSLSWQLAICIRYLRAIRGLCSSNAHPQKLINKSASLLAIFMHDFYFESVDDYDYVATGSRQQS